MVGARPAGLATLFAVTVKLPDDLMLHPLGGEARELEQWLTMFHLASVVLDPYTNESSWILKSAVRVLEGFRGSDARVNFVVTADEDDTRRFLGPLCDAVPRVLRPEPHGGQGDGTRTAAGVRVRARRRRAGGEGRRVEPRRLA